MCGIAGIVSTEPVSDIGRRLDTMNRLQAHRGPDGKGIWIDSERKAGLGHRRLSVIDLKQGKQPMRRGCSWITYNGEVYNFEDLRSELGGAYQTKSDTEVVLGAYELWKEGCLKLFRGMFAFAIWNEQDRTLFAARDRFGIKPLYYYMQQGKTFYLSSEMKALMPFMERLEVDSDAMADYRAFQFCLGGKTMLNGIQELPPGHYLVWKDGRIRIERYWDVFFEPDFDHTEKYFREKLAYLLDDSVQAHLRSDVPVGTYVSGGLDSSIVTALAVKNANVDAFSGTFRLDSYDETRFASELASFRDFQLFITDIHPMDFVDHIESVIYHLDQPIVGPGAFPQFMLSRFVAEQKKVVLGGQGGDELFGGYARYLIAYLEQCLLASIDGTAQTGNYIATYDTLGPSLRALERYKPLLRRFWRRDVFGDPRRRYFDLIDRSSGHLETGYDPFESFLEIFDAGNVGNSYLDRMTHFDFKTLLPALLHVEDRMSMAHGLEARVPFLDHPIVELAASIPADMKFKDGRLKHILRETFQNILPRSISERKDKMGFPVPLAEWMSGPVGEYVRDTIGGEVQTFDRETWGLLSTSIWEKRVLRNHTRFEQFSEDTCEYLSPAGPDSSGHTLPTPC